MRVEAVMVVWFCLRSSSFERLGANVGDSHLFCYTLRNYVLYRVYASSRGSTTTLG